MRLQLFSRKCIYRWNSKGLVSTETVFSISQRSPCNRTPTGISLLTMWISDFFFFGLSIDDEIDKVLVEQIFTLTNQNTIEVKYERLLIWTRQKPCFAAEVDLVTWLWNSFTLSFTGRAWFVWFFFIPIDNCLFTPSQPLRSYQGDLFLNPEPVHCFGRRWNGHRWFWHMLARVFMHVYVKWGGGGGGGGVLSFCCTWYLKKLWSDLYTAWNTAQVAVLMKLSADQIRLWLNLITYKFRPASRQSSLFCGESYEVVSIHRCDGW